jgi:hypothetical protein
MLFFVEVGLTAWAWTRGWKAKALLPLGIIIPIGFVLGLVVGVGGGDANIILVFGGLLDLIAIGVLIFMIAKPPARAYSAQMPPAAASAGAWHADPMGRHQYRYFNGTEWTNQVSDDGVQSVDEGVS